MFTPSLRRSARALALGVCAIVSLAQLRAQSIAISEGVQTYGSLSGATVTLTGKSELRLTASAAALSGCVINLDSPDAWLFFPNVKPATVVSTYLSQLRVGGAAAVSGTNVRVVQHEMGSVVVPHAPAFQPLQAFAGPDFSGTSSSFSQYTYYNSAGTLGSLNRAISSFRLKRGYMATFSTSTNGAGPSKVYVAQDGDLEVGRLPAELDDAVVFVRVLPWRWVSKKGSCDVAADTLNSAWFYNWNNDQNSPLNWEYVPIRQQRWWPGYPTDKPNSTHLLGFNEPDNPVEDAYETLGSGSIDTAIAVWPELLATGLRVGSPAVTDGGSAWLYEFMDKAAAAKLRVDYVAIHFYRCGYTAQQLYDWLYAVHVRTGKPIWLTEFNNGANWTSCADPSYAANATRIGEFIEMMDNAPFIERYAVYSRVEGVRQMTYDEGGLTPAGVVYRDNASPIGYQQEVPATGGRGVARLAFDDTLRDSSGFSNHGLAASAPTFVDSPRGRAIDLDGATQFVQLPANVAASSAFSFAGWVYWDGGANWQRIFDFGDDTSRYFFLTPSSGAGTLRFATRNAGSEQTVETTALPVGQWTHVAVTLSGGVARLYINGAQAASASVSITPAQITPTLNYLGRSRFPADPLFNGRLDEVSIVDYAYTPAQVAALMTNTPPQFASPAISGGAATQGQPYSGTITGSATDPDAGDTLAYSKSSGPAWLQIAADGTLSGTPGLSDSGAQTFVVVATDSAGSTAFATLTITLPVVAGNGTWSADADGLWSDVTKWTSSFPANGAGFAANFNTLNIGADRVVTLDGSRTVGALRFADASGAQNWTLAGDGASSLTLDSGSTTAPSVVVSQNTARIAAPLAGTNGLAKTGSGTLILAGANTLSGTVYIDTSNTTTNEGVVRAAHPGALASVSTISIRNNNSGSSTLELDGSLGGVSGAPLVNLSGRTNTVPALRNLSGANTLSGTLTLQSGGSNYILQADAGALTLGALTSGASGSRTITFQGAGNFVVGGVPGNGSATDGLGFVKTGAGRLALNAASTATGNVTINGGTLAVLGSGALYAGAWNNTAVLAVNSGGVLELDRWGYGLPGAYRTQALGGLSYGAERLVINGGTIRYTGGAAGAPQNPAEAPYGPGFTIGSLGATLDAAKANDTWTVKNDSRGGGPVVSSSGGKLTLTGVGDGIFDKVLPGTGGLTKTGAGTWTLPLANTYTGVTSIQGGVLRVTGSTATGTVSVENGGTLAGTGTLGGPGVVYSGGVIEPGLGGIGTLTFSSANLALLSGSTVRMEINKTAGLRDRLVVGGTLTLNGTLSVANLSGTPVAGDSFALFTAGSYAGAFAGYTLPALPAGLGWNTSSLAIDGTLRVVALSDFSGWTSAQNLPAGQQASDADPDGDGVANAFEWLHGTSPLGSEASAPASHTARELTPAEYPAAEPAKTYLTLTARIRKNLTGLTLLVQASDSLATLDAAPAASSTASFLVADEGEFETRTWLFTTPLQDSPTGRAFMRLKLVAE